MRLESAALVVALATSSLIAVALTPTVADADTCQPPAACPHSVPMTSTPDPSIQGQFVQFRIDFGQWCAYGGHPFHFVAVAPSLQTIDLGYGALPATGHVLYFATTRLAAGSYRVSSSTYLCYETPTIGVSLYTNEVFQTVRSKPAGPAPFRPAPSTVKPSEPTWQVVIPAVHVEARTLLPRLANFHTAATVRQSSPSAPSGSGLAVLVAAAVAASVAAAVRRRRSPRPG